MNPFHRTLFTAIAALVLANSLAYAADPSAVNQQVLVNQAIVQSVDTTNNALQVQDSAGARQSIKVVSGMTVYRNGTPALVTDLNPGDLISIQASSAAPVAH